MKGRKKTSYEKNVCERERVQMSTEDQGSERASAAAFISTRD